MIKLTPYGVGEYPQVPNPVTWTHDIDMHKQQVTLSLHSGILINLEKTTDGYLHIKPASGTSPLPFINVANSGRNTMVRVYTGSHLESDPSRVVGQYLTAPGGIASNPSRTTVDRYGNVWIGNRGVADENGGSITEFGVVIGGERGKKNSQNPGPDGKYHITRGSDGKSLNPNGPYLEGPFIYNTCIDRNGDGLIRTSGSISQQLLWPNTRPNTPNNDSLAACRTLGRKNF